MTGNSGRRKKEEEVLIHLSTPSSECFIYHFPFDSCEISISFVTPSWDQDTGFLGEGNLLHTQRIDGFLMTTPNSTRQLGFRGLTTFGKDGIWAEWSLVPTTGSDLYLFGIPAIRME